jgi:hypothetical protein
MTTMREIEQRLRSARPQVEASPPPLAAVLARVELAGGRPHARRWWRRRTGVALVLAATVLVGAGGSALLLAPGKPVPPAFVLPANPAFGLGRPLTPSLALLPLRAADPAGGPPWGMRVIRTSRGLTCLQAGRVVDGRLGALGIGYAFHGDGRFHPFMAADAISADSCPTVDSGGFAFLPAGATVISADGLPLAGENIYPENRVHCDLPGQEDWGIRCPEWDLREVALGLLGPVAERIEVSTPERRFSVRPYGTDGAYLIVLPPPPHANTGRHGFLGRPAPGTPTLTVIYSDGSRCEIPAIRPAQACKPTGVDNSMGAPPKPAQVKAPIHVAYRAAVSHAIGPLSAIGPDGRAMTPPSHAPDPGVLVSFKAPVAAPSASSAYDVQLTPRRVRCATPALKATAPTPAAPPPMIVSQPTDRTLAAGQRVQITVPLPSSCPTTYLGRVLFLQSGSRYGEPPLYILLGGRGSAKLGLTVARFVITAP